jgi:hypothetical protein
MLFPFDEAELGLVHDFDGDSNVLYRNARFYADLKRWFEMSSSPVCRRLFLPAEELANLPGPRLRAGHHTASNHAHRETYASEIQSQGRRTGHP